VSAAAAFLRPPIGVPAALDPKHNHLLAALPQSVFGRWSPHLEYIKLPMGRVLHECGQVVSHLYFPSTAVVSLLNVMKNGAAAELAVVGNEGVIGISLFMGVDSTPTRAVIQSPGWAFRLRSQVFSYELERSTQAQRLLLRYTQARITQLSQTAACNRHHLLDQQLCRWLLLRLDRLPSNELFITQEMIANLLGVRREGVTAAAARLQKEGLIRYSRGRIMVLDRARLADRACECYAVVKQEYDRLLPAPTVTWR
jgi:CRP-like cAMP-binding protein